MNLFCSSARFLVIAGCLPGMSDLIKLCWLCIMLTGRDVDVLQGWVAEAVYKCLVFISQFTWYSDKRKGKGKDIAVRIWNHYTATGNHMPYAITQWYLPPGSGDFPAFTPAEAGTRFSDPGEMQGWVDLVGGYIPRKFTCEMSVSYTHLTLPTKRIV